MWSYEKRLQYPINIKNPNPKLAKIIISQYGGPHGELGASLRYISQRYTMPYAELKAILTDIATEELGHLEMVSTIVHARQVQYLTTWFRARLFTRSQRLKRFSMIPINAA